jgi:hypothetical protein
MSKIIIEPNTQITEEQEIESPGGKADQRISEDETPHVEEFMGQSIYNQSNE